MITKKLIKDIAIIMMLFAIPAAIYWAMVAFYYLDWNFTHWSTHGRGLYIICTVVTGFILSLLTIGDPLGD